MSAEADFVLYQLANLEVQNESTHIGHGNFAVPLAMARTLPVSTCELASGSDTLQSFELVDDGGENVSINGVPMRDIAPHSPYGIFYSPTFADYNFAPRPSSPGPSIDVLKRDGSRAIYHCSPAN